MNELNKPEIKIVNGRLHMENVHITYKNFEGRTDTYNKNGDKSFSVIIPPEYVDLLVQAGWRLRIKPDLRGEGDFVTLKVKVKFNQTGPGVWLNSAGNVRKLSDETVGMLDRVGLRNIGMIIRPFDWEINGNTGRTAYLQSMEADQLIDDIAAKYQHLESQVDAFDQDDTPSF